jgi:hypothetical protein
MLRKWESDPKSSFAAAEFSKRWGTNKEDTLKHMHDLVGFTDWSSLIDRLRLF